jgi:phosphomannomutase / phosphoglucomutase
MVSSKDYQLNAFIEPSLFRMYDIRGDASTLLTEDVMYVVARAIAKKAHAGGQKSIVIARDGRLSSDRLCAALRQGLLDSAMNVFDIGLVPSPLMYYATYSLATHAGVIVTGSHNPKQDNGLKIILSGRTLCDQEIQELYQLAMAQNFISGSGQITEVEVAPSYIDRIINHLGHYEGYKVVLDCGNGAASQIAPLLFKHLGCEVIPLFCKVDGNFPNHHPDPTQRINQTAIIAKVQETKADLGLAFDGDGDRIVAFASDGSVIWPESMLMLFAKDVLKTLPGRTVVYDVKCSASMDGIITQAGGKPKMARTGHSLLKAEMIASQAPLAGELSGHIFFADQWYGFDDGLYAGVRFLDLMKRQKTTSLALLNTLPQRIATEELKIMVPEHDKQQIMAQLVQQFKQDQAQKSLILLDGVRVHYADGWGLVRASNTTPCLTCRFEADNHASLERIVAIFVQHIKRAYPQVEIAWGTTLT